MSARGRSRADARFRPWWSECKQGFDRRSVALRRGCLAASGCRRQTAATQTGGPSRHVGWHDSHTGRKPPDSVGQSQGRPEASSPAARGSAPPAESAASNGADCRIQRATAECQKGPGRYQAPAPRAGRLAAASLPVERRPNKGRCPAATGTSTCFSPGTVCPPGATFLLGLPLESSGACSKSHCSPGEQGGMPAGAPVLTVWDWGPE